ncbi:MAG: hypothetical protein COB66_06160 [Coxiella sp. (in: Bacteria)]|nr:MAG: hypothetical protein COB66_06160 [Coxiella sp. (in: g-proteobacteria)]
MIDYDASAIVSFLQIYGIKLKPQGLNTVEELPGEVGQPNELPHHYFYPSATKFPINSLIRDTVDYFSHTKGMIKDRRVGILIQSADGRLMALAVNLSKPQMNMAKSLKEDVDKLKDTSTNTLLKNQELVTRFRQLYAKAECVLLGLNMKGNQDAPIAQQIGSLIGAAYAIKLIHFNLIPLATQPSNAILFNDLLTVFKHGAFMPNAIKAMINHRPHVLKAQQRAAIIDPFIKRLEKIKSMSEDLYQQFSDEATKFHRHHLIVQWRNQQHPVDLAQYAIFKQNTYTAPFNLEQFLRESSIDVLLPLVIQEQAVGILQLLQLYEQNVLKDLEAWEASAKEELEKTKKTDLKSKLYDWLKLPAVLAYQSTLIPVGGEVIPLLMKEMDKSLDEEGSWYRRIKGYAQHGLQQASKGLAYGMTFSDDLSERFSQRVLTTMSSRSARQVSGGLLGLYFTYLLGVYTLLRTFAFVALTQQLFRYGYTQHLDNATASVSPAKFKDIPLHTLGRMVGVMIGIAEVAYRGNAAQLLVCLGGYAGSLCAVKLTEDPRQQPSADDKTIAFLSSQGGQQLGRAVVSLMLLMYITLDARNQRRELFLDYFRGQAENSGLEDVEILFPNWIFNVWNLMTGHDPVGLTFSNPRDGLFYNGNCDIGPEGLACDPAMPSLRNITITATL